MTDAERRAREILTEKLGCPVSMQLTNTFEEGTYSAVYFNSEAQIGHDYEDMRPAYGLCLTPHYADKGPVESVEADITQDVIDDVISQVESRLNLTGLLLHMDGRTFNNWGPCLCVRAQVADDCVMSILIGCDDGREHGLKLDYGTLTDTLPVYVNNDG